MSIEVVESLVSQFSPDQVDVVGVYDQNFNPVFQAARTIKAAVARPSKLMEHPVESGSANPNGGASALGTIGDYRIIEPVKIELSLILNSKDYVSVYQQIAQLFLNGTILIVQTQADVFKDQFIESLPHEESGDKYQTIIIALPLREVQFVKAVYSDLPAPDPSKSQAQSSNTVNRGGVQTQSASGAEEKKSSELYNLFN